MQKNSYGKKIEVAGQEFLLDGKPLRILSGSLHYFRVPREYWRDRLRKVRAAGLNSVATYVDWSFHEPDERQYMFSGDHDVGKFIKLAAKEDLFVLLRIGPYIGAERDMGGLPYWLLSKYPNISLRCNDEDFLNETRTWMNKLFSYLSSLLVGNGGPIILIQVENEYGDFGDDEAYKERLVDIFYQHVGGNALLYTADGTNLDSLTNGYIPDTITSINILHDASLKKIYGTFRKISNGPLMVSEFYTGWINTWSQRQSYPSEVSIVERLCELIKLNASLNFYMFCGGTNFEFTSGAISKPGQRRQMYSPVVTSYDYGAPVSEAGDLTPKYYAIREAISKCTGRRFVAKPTNMTYKGHYGTIILKPQLNLLSHRGRSILGKLYPRVSGTDLPTYEKLRQRAGLLLFETIISGDESLLTVTRPHDRIYVYVNYEFNGIIDRFQGTHNLMLSLKPNSTWYLMSLLVENQGRLNIGHFESKGILSPVLLNGRELIGPWNVTGFPLKSMKFVRQEEWFSVRNGPVLYEGQFVLSDELPIMDTFLDPTGWGKGYVWVNGHNLGRYWPAMGPQVTLYLPGVWLKSKPDRNILHLLELETTPDSSTVKLISKSILNRLPTRKIN